VVPVVFVYFLALVQNLTFYSKYNISYAPKFNTASLSAGFVCSVLVMSFMGYILGKLILAYVRMRKSLRGKVEVDGEMGTKVPTTSTSLKENEKDEHP
jgi:hypothetical protein